MGCDIHMYVEYRKEFRVEGSKEKEQKWVLGDYFKKNPYHGIYKGEGLFTRLELYGHRDYSLFSTLAGVRDYSDKMVPVAEPKGIPKDCCAYVAEEAEGWSSDGHSHSWLTLKEIRDYQAGNPRITYTGLLHPTDLKKLDKDGIHPQSWCQGTNQEGFERREWSEDNTVLLPLIELMEGRVKELLQYDWQEYLPSNDENIRIVFWFDN